MTMTHSPDWLERFRGAIEEIESGRAQWLIDLLTREPQLFAQFSAAMSAETADADARDHLIATLADVLRPAMAENERGRVRLLADLAPLYDHLRTASREDWEAYIELLLAVRARAAISVSEWLRRGVRQAGAAPPS